MKPALVIFDLDGVLVDSEWLLASVWSTMLGEHGIAIAPETLIDRFAGKTDGSMADVIARETGTVPAQTMLDSVRDRARAALSRDLQPVPGAQDLLNGLPFNACVCSNSASDRVRRSLTVTRLISHFEDAHLFSADQVARAKPHPDLHLHALAVMGVAPEEAVVIEDSATGIEAAGLAGISSIGFLGASHVSEGHGEALEAAGASSVVHHHDSLLQVIAEL